MTTYWGDIFPDVSGPPVRGEPGDFDTAARAFTKFGNGAERIIDEFALLAKGDSANFQGEAAEAFAGVVSEVKSSLKDLPRVADKVADVLGDHADRLRDLREAADKALARAAAHWQDKQKVERDLDDANRKVSSIRSQINSLPAACGDPVADASTESSRTSLDTNRVNAEGSVRRLEADLDDVKEALRREREKWDDLHADEKALRKKTKGRLDDIDLGKLSDPSLVSQVLNAAFKVAKIVITVAIPGFAFAMHLVEAFQEHGWTGVLFALKDALEIVLTVAGIVMLLFPVSWVVVAVVAGLAVTAFAITAVLYKTGAKDPKTGKPISTKELIFSGISAALSVAGGFSAVKGAMGGTKTVAAGYKSLIDGARAFGGNVRATGSAAASAGRAIGNTAQDTTEIVVKVSWDVRYLPRPGEALEFAGLVAKSYDVAGKVAAVGTAAKPLGQLGLDVASLIDTGAGTVKLGDRILQSDAGVVLVDFVNDLPQLPMTFVPTPLVFPMPVPAVAK